MDCSAAIVAVVVVVAMTQGAFVMALPVALPFHFPAVLFSAPLFAAPLLSTPVVAVIVPALVVPVAVVMGQQR